MFLLTSATRQVGGSLVVSLIHLLAGSSIPLSSIILPNLQVNNEESSWFASIIFLGMSLGSLAGSVYCDIIGRRSSLIIDCFGFLSGFLLIGLGGEINIYLLCIGRVLTGFFMGTMKCSMMIYICEFCEPKYRGLVGGLNMLVFMIGFTAPFLLNMMCHWTVVTLSLSAPSLIAILGLFCLQESPVWLMRKKGEEQAIKSLKFFRGEETDIKKGIEDIKQSIAYTNESNQTKLSMMMTRSFYRPFLYFCYVMMALEWSSYPVLGTYMITIFQKTGSALNPNTSSLVVCSVRICFAAFTSSLLLRFPRRRIYFVAASVTCLSLLLLGGYVSASEVYDLPSLVNILPLVLIICIYIGFSLGYGTISIILQGEVFPPEMRSLGCGVIFCLEMISSFAATKCSGYIIGSIGLQGLFWLYSVVVFSVIVTAYFFMPETKDKTLAQIQAEYQK